MKIEKAIEVLTSDVKGSFKHSFTQVKEAEQLGIEALERLASERKKCTGWSVRPLLGEGE